jgi:hypothetical protein
MRETARGLHRAGTIDKRTMREFDALRRPRARKFSAAQIRAIRTRSKLSQAVFAAQDVGIREVSEKIWLVTFMHYDLGFIDHQSGRVECAPNPFGAKLLPMSPE